jgi:ribosomal peptide maturation radical SAM protein 1
MNVLIVAMPFAGIRPAMGASLLVGHLRRIGVEAQVRYLNMDMARRLGRADYDYVADRVPTQSLAGDWVFSTALFGARPAADEAYRDMFRERFSRYVPYDAALAALARARAQAEPFIDGCLAGVDWAALDAVGFTSSFTQHTASLALARRLKEAYPRLPIIFGGANCEDMMGLALHRCFPFVDYVCSGEADISFPRLIQALAQGEEPHGIPGVISRRGGESYASSLVPDRIRDLDDLPYPVFDGYFEQRAAYLPGDRKASAGILMETSRGCWWGEKHHCTFCGLNGMAMTYRRKSAERAMKEITELSSRYNPEHIEMVDNILDMGSFASLLPWLAERDLHLRFFYETKANLSKDQLRLLRAAGVTAIQPGVESLSTGVLRLMRKGTTAAQNIQLLKWCSEIGIQVHWNLLYGFPDEDPVEYAAMAQVMESITHLTPPNGFGKIRLDRFSPNFMSADQMALCNVRPDRSYELIYDLPADQLADLAYYFEHDYLDGRDPSAYFHDSERAARRWIAGHNPWGLVYVDHGAWLAIWDFRPVSQRLLTILEPWERQIYLHCDQHRSWRSIEDIADSWPGGQVDVGGLLGRLVADRLMVLLDGRYLSLAVPLATASVPHAEPALIF